jgi:hypothetical protein
MKLVFVMNAEAGYDAHASQGILVAASQVMYV